MAFKGSSSALFPDSDSEEEQGDKGLGLNKDYAQRYDRWRNKEELMKMKARFGTTNLAEIGSGSDSDSTSTEEENWSEEKEKAFFKTLSVLKQKDPKIYDPNVRFFKGEVEGGDKETDKPNENEKKKKKEKPFLLKDHERTMILEKGGLLSDDEEEEKEPPRETLTYHQELAEIKKGFTAALQGSDEESEDEGLLKKGKEKSEEQKKQEDEDYRKWLKGEIKRLEGGKLSKDEQKELSFLRSYWTDEKLDEGEAFLRDYVLNKRYMEPEEKERERAGYNEVAHDSDEGGLSNDEEFEKNREEFEHKYNFRFEEPDPEFIKRFPRTIADSMRREDERRKKHRESAKDRKQDAKERKREEVQRLKALKRKEIMDKLKQLQEVTGQEDLPLDDLDIDGDFDPAEYDKRMQKVFSDEYYNDGDEEKPEFPYDPEIDDEVKWDEWVPPSEEDDQPEAEDEESDEEQPTSSKKKKKSKKVDEDPEEKPSSSSSLTQELIEISKGGKKGKKQSPFLQALEKKKPKFDPKVHKSFEQYFKEYYSLDFEDLIGDLPCRFKYRKVAPNDFGLTTEEILKAPDKELNQWASLKKTYQYRANEEEQYEAQAYKKKAENDRLKKRVLMSVYLPGSNPDADFDEDENEAVEGVAVKEEPESGHEDEKNSELAPSKKKKKKKKKSTKKKKEDDDDSVTVKVEPEDHEEQEEQQGSRLSDSSEKIKEENPLPENGSETSHPKLSKRQRKNLKKHIKPEQNGGSNGTSPSKPTIPQSPNQNKNQHSAPQKNKKQWKPPKNLEGERGQKRKAETEGGMNDERLKAYGVNPKKYKKWVKYGESSQNRTSHN